MKLSIGELVLISRFLQCSLEELVILQGDTYTGLPCENGEGKPELETAKAVQEYISMVEKQNSECKIRNLNEFLLYLPLVNEAVVRDVVFRCYGNLEIDESNYMRSQMNYLYKTIPDCPEKRYADWYRDNVLRVKGHPREDFLGESYGDAYFLKILEYGGGLGSVKKHS